MNSILTKIKGKRAGVYMRLTRQGLYIGQSQDYNRRYPEYIRCNTISFVPVEDAAARLSLERAVIRFYCIQDDVPIVNRCHASDKGKFRRP